MLCVGIRAINMPDFNVSTVILDLGVPDLQRGEVTVSRNTTKKNGAKNSAFSYFKPRYCS